MYYENATRDEPSTLWFIPQTDPFKVPAITTEEFKKGPELYNLDKDKDERKKEWANFYSSDDYAKDGATNLMMAPNTEETCNANDGFVCKVTLKSKNDNMIGFVDKYDDNNTMSGPIKFCTASMTLG